MISPLRLLGIAIGVAGGLGLAAASAIPVGVNGNAESAMIRVAFSARPQRIETCRTPSQEELAEVPVHMRQSVVCEGITASYRLDVLRDDSLLSSTALHGGGLRRDRQLYVLRELFVPPGPSIIEVRLTRLDSLPASADSIEGGGREAEERQRRMEDEVPSSLTLRESVPLELGEVLLVTYDQSTRRFRMVRRDR